jgi:hypothetical protein
MSAPSTRAGDVGECGRCETIAVLSAASIPSRWTATGEALPLLCCALCVEFFATFPYGEKAPFLDDSPAPRRLGAAARLRNASPEAVAALGIVSDPRQLSLAEAHRAAV